MLYSKSPASLQLPASRPPIGTAESMLGKSPGNDAQRQAISTRDTGKLRHVRPDDMESSKNGSW